MKTTMIEMSPRAARTEAERYARCGDKLTKTDRAIMRAYKSIARGGRLINLIETMRAGGTNEAGLPRLAICRADAEWVTLRLYPGLLEFAGDRGRWSKREIRMENVTSNQGSAHARAKLPFIPPYLRRQNLGDLFILWEATWGHVPKGDPYLLDRIDQNIYRIVAAWDITPLEAAVLRR